MTRLPLRQSFAVVALAAAAWVQPAHASELTQAVACNTTRTITVNGAAMVTAMPDYATVSFGVNVNAKTSAEALSALKTSTLTIRGKLQEAGTASRDIATDEFNIVPFADQYASQRSDATEFRYATSGRLDVTVRDLKRMSEVIDIAFKAGANTMSSVQLQDSKLRAHRDEARVLAVKAAAEKAALLAAASGTAVGCVLKIDEIKTFEQGGWWNPGGSAQAQNVVQASGEDARYSLDETTVAPGSIRVRAEVQIMYGLQ